MIDNQALVSPWVASLGLHKQFPQVKPLSLCPLYIPSVSICTAPINLEEALHVVSPISSFQCPVLFSLFTEAQFLWSLFFNDQFFSTCSQKPGFLSLTSLPILADSEGSTDFRKTFEAHLELSLIFYRKIVSASKNNILWHLRICLWTWTYLGKILVQFSPFPQSKCNPAWHSPDKQDEKLTHLKHRC